MTDGAELLLHSTLHHRVTRSVLQLMTWLLLLLLPLLLLLLIWIATELLSFQIGSQLLSA